MTGAEHKPLPLWDQLGSERDAASRLRKRKKANQVGGAKRGPISEEFRRWVDVKMK